MTYLINDIFYTLQGEGYWTGRPAVFVRLSRCNLWSGREEDRATAICKFCDTNFLHGQRMTLQQITNEVRRVSNGGHNMSPADILCGPKKHMVVLTGGEPSLQVDDELLLGLRSCGFYIAIETNGTRALPLGIDWVCVSPKRDAPLVVVRGDELKVVYPQPGIELDWLAGLDFTHFWLSPMDGPNLAENTAAAIEYVLAHPQWRLNTQTHKAIGVK